MTRYTVRQHILYNLLALPIALACVLAFCAVLWVLA
jgi:hypothetical protein